MNPFLQAVLRIAQGHYGGRPSSAWLKRLSANPEAQTTIGRRLMFNLGTGTPGQIQGMTKDKIGGYFG
jgi:hypothetical protein